jgi:hypothetical protein
MTHKANVKSENDPFSSFNDDRKPSALPSTKLKPNQDLAPTICSPYIPPTQEEIERYSYNGPRRSDHVRFQDSIHSTEFVKASSLLPIPESDSATILFPDSSSETIQFPNQSKSTTSVQPESRPKDYSMRSNMITERIRFELVLDSIENVDVRTKALIIFGKLINVDPSRKILSFLEDDERSSPLLEKAHDLPQPIDKMSKYLASPMLNPKTKRLQFHTRFRSVTSLLEMKRDNEFMKWLKTNQIYTTVMTLNSTENTRAGFFLGKGPHITNLSSFTQWIKDRLASTTAHCPDFQLNIEGIGRHKDPSTKSRAIVAICSNKDVRLLREILDSVFNSLSNFPFIPFPVMYSLDIKTQSALYKAHKSKIFGQDMLEIGIPDFHGIDTTVIIDKRPTSLRDVCFDLKSPDGSNTFVDVDNATRSGITVFQAKKDDKIYVMDTISKWIKSQFNIVVKWDSELHFEAKTYRLDPKYRSLANQFSALATSSFLPLTVPQKSCYNST